MRKNLRSVALYIMLKISGKKKTHTHTQPLEVPAHLDGGDLLRGVLGTEFPEFSGMVVKLYQFENSKSVLVQPSLYGKGRGISLPQMSQRGQCGTGSLCHGAEGLQALCSGVWWQDKK